MFWKFVCVTRLTERMTRRAIFCAAISLEDLGREICEESGPQARARSSAEICQVAVHY